MLKICPTYLYLEIAEFSLFLCLALPLGGDRMSMLTHTYPLKPLEKIKMAVCSHQADCPFYLKSDAWIGDLYI